MPSPWTRLRGALDPVARTYGQYTAYRLAKHEFVGHVDGMTVADARWFLDDRGYAPQYLSAAKRHPETGQLHDLSYRRVPDEHPLVDASVTDDWRPSQCQYHIHAFERGGGVDFYSHYEAKPDLWPPNPRRLRTHYRPEYGEDYLRGVTDLEL